MLFFYNNVRELQERKNEIISEKEAIFISKNISSRKNAPLLKMIMNYVGVEIYHKNKLKGKTTINIRVLALKNVEKSC